MSSQLQAVPVTRAREDAREAFAPGAWAWQADSRDHLRVRLQFTPGVKIEVGIWWNRDGGHPDVQLIFGLYSGSVELGCLQGNGYNAPGLHQAGFGTLAVNVAIQALQRCCAPGLLVEGVLSNTDEIGLPAQERARLEENRRAFWRRFGLSVVQRGTPPLDYLHGHVRDLHTVDHGTVAGQFPRCIALQNFTRA
jgi:hypothetical protein